MHLDHTTPASHPLSPPAVEIGIWEGYLVKNPANIARTLCAYSLDNGPLQETTEGTLIFRFAAYDWQKNIEGLLTRNNIHFAVLRNLCLDVSEQLLKKEIFVAEDDPDILAALSGMLENAGHHVRIAASGIPVLHGNYSRVDLFILDKQMPDLDGLEICRRLRQQAATRDTPVIVISAHPKAGNEALLAGANDYIEKPFEMHYLLNVVSGLLKRAT